MLAKPKQEKCPSAGAGRPQDLVLGVKQINSNLMIILLISIYTRIQRQQTKQDHVLGVTCLAFHPTNPTIFSGSLDKAGVYYTLICYAMLCYNILYYTIL